MIDGDLIKLLERGVVALEKLAGIEPPRERRPATLTTATYSREERERKELREKFASGARPAGGIAQSPRSDS